MFRLTQSVTKERVLICCELMLFILTDITAESQYRIRRERDKKGLILVRDERSELCKQITKSGQNKRKIWVLFLEKQRVTERERERPII